MRDATSFTSVFLHREPMDMRKGINGLCEVVAAASLGELSGQNLFVFCGRRRNSIKVLYFDRSGFAIWQKRLDKEKFAWPKKHESEKVTITPEQLSWLLEGYDVWKMKSFSEINFKRVS